MAALAPCPSALLWVCVCVCCQRDSMTSLIKFALLEFSLHVYIQYNIHSLYICHRFYSTPLLANSSIPPLMLASLLLLLLLSPPHPPPTALLLSASHPPSVLLAQIDRIESLGLFVLPSETHIVSVSRPLSAALHVYNPAESNSVYCILYKTACVTVCT